MINTCNSQIFAIMIGRTVRIFPTCFSCRASGKGGFCLTEKELGKLKRPDLLALLVAQGREAAALQNRLAETESHLTQAVQLDNRLKAKLDEKDAQIERLKERLNEKDEQIERLKARLDEKDRRIDLLNRQVQELISGRFLELDGEVSLSDVAFKVDLVLRAAQKAANRCLRPTRPEPPLGGGR